MQRFVLVILDTVTGNTVHCIEAVLIRVLDQTSVDCNEPCVRQQ